MTPVHHNQTFCSAQALFGFIARLLGHGQQHDSTVRYETTTIEGGGDLLARNGYE
jgi:hypothetical protein